VISAVSFVYTPTRTKHEVEKCTARFAEFAAIPVMVAVVLINLFYFVFRHQ